jgi:hypothetical protein
MALVPVPEAKPELVNEKPLPCRKAERTVRRVDTLGSSLGRGTIIPTKLVLENRFHFSNSETGL